ncbi:MAG: putative membrane spanning protein [uncultured bacterium]|nr:MAG: putative membrane spanning protein [uncultured bacterium]
MSDLLVVIANPIGLLGVVLVLIAYFFLSTGRWMADSLYYQLYNLAGAVLILYSLYFHWNLSSVVIEIAWITISFIGLFRIIAKKP